jgi:DNA-binding HxlR family transcriptional regulator
MPSPPYDVYAAKCPTREALDRIADKWTALIVGRLAERPHRFSALLRAIGGVSQKMLTQTLRSLERDGLVRRVVKPTVPVTVEYSLTATGRTLVMPLEAIRTWAVQHIKEVLAARSLKTEGPTRSRRTSKPPGRAFR